MTVPVLPTLLVLMHACLGDLHFALQGQAAIAACTASYPIEAKVALASWISAPQAVEIAAAPASFDAF